MVDDSAFGPYRRKDYLASVPAGQRALAERLCELLEDAYPVSLIRIYRGFPIVVRDGEWMAGFAMRAKCPMVYCCSQQVLDSMGDELKPLMAGKSCLELREKGRLSLEQALELVGRAFRASRAGTGSISAAERAKRAKAAAKPAAEKTKFARAARKPARKA